MYAFKDVLERLKSRIKTKETLIEGFFTMTNLRAVAQEFAQAYAHIGWVEENYHLTKATGDLLDMRAADHGITRKGATKAQGYVQVQGEDGVIIPVGSVFTGGGLSFVALESATINKGIAVVHCEAMEAGAKGNILPGVMALMMDAPSGVRGVSNTGAFLGGSDMESDKLLRTRIYDKIRNPVTSGNKNHYRIWATSVEGVGAVKVIPLWSGPGTVKVSILGADGRAASEDLIGRVQAYIDPSDGKGEGVAPVGAVVTVATAKEVGITVAGHLTFAPGYDQSQAIREVRRLLNTYFIGTAYDGLTKKVSVAQIMYIIMSAQGVIDCENVTMNDSMDNITIDEESVLVLAGTNFNGVKNGSYFGAEYDEDAAHGVSGSVTL